MIAADGCANDDSAIELRRQKLIARLEKRNESVKPSNLGSEKKEDEANLEALISKASEDAEQGISNPEVIAALKNCLSQCKGRTLFRVQEALELQRKAALPSSSGRSGSGFSFAKPVASNVSKIKKAPVTPIENSIESDRTTLSDANLPENAVMLSDMENSEQRVAGVDGSSVSIKNITSCTLIFDFSPSAVHIQNILNSRIYFPNIESSILIYNIKGSSVYAIGQQIRVHDATNVKLHVSVRGAVILEGCTGVHMAPYRLLRNGVPIDTSNGTQWRNPKDFDWLAEGQSPNWSILPEDLWDTSEY